MSATLLFEVGTSAGRSKRYVFGGLFFCPRAFVEFVIELARIYFMYDSKRGWNGSSQLGRCH